MRSVSNLKTRSASIMSAKIKERKFYMMRLATKMKKRIRTLPPQTVMISMRAQATKRKTHVTKNANIEAPIRDTGQ